MTLSILFTAIAYSIACLGMGSLVMRIIDPKGERVQSSAILGISNRFLLGQGMLATLWVFLALAGSFSPLIVKSIIVLFFMAGIAVTYKTIPNLLLQVKAIWSEIQSEPMGWKTVTFSAVIGCLIWVPFWFPLETSGSRYYMAIAKVISASEQLKVLPGYEEVASLGMQGEMQFAALMTLGSPESTQVFSWLTLTAGCMLLLSLGRLIGLDRRSQWLALAMVFTSSAVIILSGSGKTDIYGAAFAFAAYYWAFRFEEKNRIQTSILVGLFSGMAVMAKLNYAVNFLPSLALILFWKIFLQPQKISFKSHVLPLLIMGLGGLFIASQMPVKNQFLFGDPMAAFNTEDIASQVWYGAETIRRVYLLLPFSLTIGAFWGQGGGISTLILAFLPLLFFLPKAKRWLENPLLVASASAIFGLLCWFVAYPSNFALRYFLACALLLVLPMAKAAADFAYFGKSNERLVQIPVVIFVVYTVLGYVSYPLATDGTLRQIMTGEANCNNETMRCLIESNVNERLASGERIFTYTRHRYWLRPDLIQCASTTEEINNYPSLESSEMRWRYLVGRGFQSVLVENRNTTIPNIIRADLQEIPDWLTIKVLQEDENIFYFQLIPSEDTISSLYQCRQLTPPAWNVSEVSLP